MLAAQNLNVVHVEESVTIWFGQNSPNQPVKKIAKSQYEYESDY